MKKISLLHGRRDGAAGNSFSVLRRLSSVLRVPFFADLVVIARSLYPIPSRTRPSKSSAPMVLSLKAWKSRSLPGLPRTEHPLSRYSEAKAPRFSAGLFCCLRRLSDSSCPRSSRASTSWHPSHCKVRGWPDDGQRRLITPIESF